MVAATLVFVLGHAFGQDCSDWRPRLGYLDPTYNLATDPVAHPHDLHMTFQECKESCCSKPDCAAFARGVQVSEYPLDDFTKLNFPGACRAHETDETTDGEGAAYKTYEGTCIESCARVCQRDQKCRGFEYEPTGGYCELWNEVPKHAESSPHGDFSCHRRSDVHALDVPSTCYFKLYRFEEVEDDSKVLGPNWCCTYDKDAPEGSEVQDSEDCEAERHSDSNSGNVLGIILGILGAICFVVVMAICMWRWKAKRCSSDDAGEEVAVGTIAHPQAAPGTPSNDGAGQTGKDGVGKTETVIGVPISGDAPKAISGMPPDSAQSGNAPQV